MRTKKFLITTAAMLMMLAMIGSGFSYWFFGNQLQDWTQTGTVSVTQLVETGSITPADNFSIQFDQTQKGREDNGNNVNLGDTPAGITFVFSGSNPTKTATYTNTTLDGTGIAFKFSVSIKLPTTLAEYITISSSQSGWNAVADTPKEVGTDTVWTFYSTASKSFDWDQVTISYADTKEPANKDAYNAFKNIVDGVTSFTVTYNAVIGTAAS